MENWTKKEIEEYISCNADQILMLAKNHFHSSVLLADYKLKNKPTIDKVEFVVKQICYKSHSQKLIELVLKYYRKICYFTGLLKSGAFKTNEFIPEEHFYEQMG